MTICVSERMAAPSAGPVYVRVLRWIFRRQDDMATCELSLTGEDSAYELRVSVPWNPDGVTTQVFDDAMPAFQRQAALERMLLEQGWSLDGFESHRLPVADVSGDDASSVVVSGGDVPVRRQ